MSRWWRAYDEAVDDPKLQLLPPPAFKTWFNLVCLTSANGGVLPKLNVIAFKLRMTEEKAKYAVAELVALGLFDERDGKFIPHNWEGRQFKSDVTDQTAAERMRNYRSRKRNAVTAKTVTEPVTVTVPRVREQNTETEKKEDIRAVADATRPVASEKFDQFWKEYPRRDGANPKAPAQKIFAAAVKSGHEAADIIAGAQRYASALRSSGQIATPYVAQAVTWLRQIRWQDYPAPVAQPPPDSVPKPPRPDLPSHEELLKKYAQQPSSEEGKGLWSEGPRVLQGHAGPEGCAPGHKTGNGGMVQLGTLLHRIPGIRSGSDTNGPMGQDPGDDSSSPVA